MKKRVEAILQEVLEKINPPKEELDIIKNSLEEFLEKFRKSLKSLRINAEIFVGGSFAKNTLIKKNYYDIDIFIRFDKKYKDKEISDLTEKALKEFKNFSKIHGSRDYFRIDIGPSFFIELIPVIKIKNQKEAVNITDLSYSHVRYIKKKLKSKQILDEIKLAKAFCYANQSYGAESYINGFSGYALELLILHYGGFLKFVKAMSKAEDKLVIDIEKHYKNKSQVMMDVNSSKLKSPIILIDPTYKQRNALAALSTETLKKFQKNCKKFLTNPDIKAFEIEKIDLEKIKNNAKRKKYEFILIMAETNKQPGDVAGSKLLKFHKHFVYEMEKFFDIKDKGFDYGGKKVAEYFFVVKNKKEIIFSGPTVKDKQNLSIFKKKHKNIYNRRAYSKKKIKFNIKEFVKNWKNKNEKKLKEMQISKLKIIE